MFHSAVTKELPKWPKAGKNQVLLRSCPEENMHLVPTVYPTGLTTDTVTNTMNRKLHMNLWCLV